MRPVIGIPCAIVSGGWYGPTVGNYLSYLRALEAAGAIPQLIHLTSDQEVLRTLYSRVDGLLFAGGVDIDPARYGEQPHPKLGEISPVQDEVELLLFGWAKADAKPILGICRGHQLLNVALGGTLYQDVAAQREGALNHRASEERKEWCHLAHPIALAADSWLAGCLDSELITTNTLHHQGIKDLAPGLRVVGTSPDGLAEAVESPDALIVGVQSHPEELWAQAEPRWARLFQGFVERCVTRGA